MTELQFVLWLHFIKNWLEIISKTKEMLNHSQSTWHRSGTVQENKPKIKSWEWAGQKIICELQQLDYHHYFCPAPSHISFSHSENSHLFLLVEPWRLFLQQSQLLLRQAQLLAALFKLPRQVVVRLLQLHVLHLGHVLFAVQVLALSLQLETEPWI